VDFGYDISDYKNIDPQYGTLADFDRLVAEAGKRHIRVLMDMVMNHTSDKHKWFLSRGRRATIPTATGMCGTTARARTATDKGAPPNNWQSLLWPLGVAVGREDAQYYYHKFYIQQPDLNWNNPKVHEAFKDIMGFWLKRGVAASGSTPSRRSFEDPSLADEGVVKDKTASRSSTPMATLCWTTQRPTTCPACTGDAGDARDTDKFNTGAFPGTRVLIGETYLPNIAELAKMYGPPASRSFICRWIRRWRSSTSWTWRVPRQADRCGDASERATRRCCSLTTTTTRGWTCAMATACTTGYSAGACDGSVRQPRARRSSTTATRSA
jgi:alpha-glucosidase